MDVPDAALIRIGPPNVVYSSRHGRLYDDKIKGTDGQLGTYLRWAWAAAGVVVIPTDGERLYLWSMYRYPIGAQSLEFPRGASNTGESPAAAAARELSEETGFTALETSVLGTIQADTGLIANSNSVVLAHIDTTRPGQARPETTEAIAGAPVILTGSKMADLIRCGGITCALTIAAFFHAIPHLKDEI